MKRILMVFFVLAALTSACKQIGDQDQKPAGAFVGGTSGVDVAFIEGEPPVSVLDNNQETFLISLSLLNNGEFTVPRSGLIGSLSGISGSAFGLSSLDRKNEFEIQGVKKDREFVSLGGEELLEFGEASYKVDIPADFTTTIRADICYQYQTKAIGNLCLKKKVLSSDIDDVCEVNINDLGAENSGAPIQVTSMRQHSVGTSSIKVTFKISNVGIGAVYEPGTFTTSCSGHEDEKDKVKVTVSNPQRTFEVKCSQFGGSNSGVVRLVNKEKEISCTIDTSNLQEITFQDLIIIQVDYMYRDAVTTQITVEDAE